MFSKIKNFKWIKEIVLSLVVLFFLTIIRGEKNNLDEILHQIKFFKSVLAFYENNPKLLVVPFFVGIFVGFVFWIIKSFKVKNDLSDNEWINNSIKLLIILFLIIFVIIKLVELFSSDIVKLFS